MDVSRWLLATKTEAVLFGTGAQHANMPDADGLNIMPFHDTVKLLGVTVDSGLTMDQHVT